MSDKDASVRDTAAETIGVLARNYHGTTGVPVPNHHILLQVALDALVNPNKDMSAAGGQALHLMASYVSSLDQDTLKHFFKLLSTESFPSKHFLLQACASWDPAKERGGGFIMRGLDTLLPAVGALVGSPKTGSKSGVHPFSFSERALTSAGRCLCRLSY